MIERAILKIRKVNELLVQTEKKVYWDNLALPRDLEDFEQDLKTLITRISHQRFNWLVAKQRHHGRG